MTPIFLTRHALERTREMSLNLAEVRQVLAAPEMTWPTWGGRRISAKGDLAVVHEADVVVTVLWRTDEPWERSTFVRCMNQDAA